VVRRPNVTWRGFVLSAGALALGALVWYLVAAVVGVLRGVSFPTPVDAGSRLFSLLRGSSLADRSLYRHLADSLMRWVVGFAVAGAAGVAYGLYAGRGILRKGLTFPLVQGLQLVPGLAWIPVALLIFGISEATTVFIIAMTVFPPVAINVLSGVESVDATYLRAARMLGADRRTITLRVLLPGALPAVLSGLRIGLGNGWRVLLAAEMVVGSGTGLGYSIIQARWTLDYPSAFACLLVILVIGLTVEYGVFARLERWTVRRWRLDGAREGL
jgi:ABC-type nitrate/sulfonate/bicarbonate transport system permease component